MRLIGKIQDGNEARMAHGLFVSRQINCRLESAGDGWELWALNEDQMLEARTLFQQFAADPHKEQYADLAAQAEATLNAAADAAARAEREYLQRMREAAVVFQEFAARPAPFSWLIIGVCVALWLMQTFAPVLLLPLRNALMIAPVHSGDMTLNALLSGEFWRLFTPALLHAPVTLPDGSFHMLNIMHVLFNLLWMKDLSPLIERRHGTGYLLVLFLVIAGGSNLLQYVWSGPNFLGLSGVVYGLLGFLWIRGRVDKTYGLRLNPGIVYFMLIWLGFCFLSEGVANGAHVGGIVIGGLWGLLSARKGNGF